MDEPIQVDERAQFAIIGIALILGAVMVGMALLSGEWWAWLALGAPLSMLLGAAARLRRIRATGQPD